MCTCDNLKKKIYIYSSDDQSNKITDITSFIFYKAKIIFCLLKCIIFKENKNYIYIECYILYYTTQYLQCFNNNCFIFSII